ncbi:MAG: TorF family putative porin [Rhodoferax sp.]
MRSISFTLLGLALASLSVGAVAQTTSQSESTMSFNVGLTSDYRYRAISQSSFKPALQAGVDYAHKSGLYVGAWVSNVSWIKDYVGATDGSTEIDFYGGYKAEIAKDVSMEFGAITYQYPGNTADKVLANANTTEVYAALTVGLVTAKYSQSTSNFMANPKSNGSRYLELAATLDLGNGYSLTPHIGRQTIPNQADNVGDYTDYALALAKDFGNGLTASLAFVGTNANDAFYRVGTFDNLGKSGAVVGLKYTF